MAVHKRDVCRLTAGALDEECEMMPPPPPPLPPPPPPLLTLRSTFQLSAPCFATTSGAIVIIEKSMR